MESNEVEVDQGVKAIQYYPSSVTERNEIEKAAAYMKQSLAGFSLFHTLVAARNINKANGL